MTNPTSNFGWQMPTSTDLVTDLPADFETFGQAVDTSLADLKGGTTGQVLSKASNTDMDFTWVAQDDSNAIQNAIVDAKGDLIAASAADTPARLAVGADDLFLTAASGETTGLKYSGGWTTWTPTFVGLTQGNGTLVARYQKIGKTVNFYLKFVFGSTSAITGYVTFTVPVTASQTPNVFQGVVYDSGVAAYPVYGEFFGGAVDTRIMTASGTYVTGALFSATAPITWGTNDSFVYTGSYEVA